MKINNLAAFIAIIGIVSFAINTHTTAPSTGAPEINSSNAKSVLRIADSSVPTPNSSQKKASSPSAPLSTNPTPAQNKVTNNATTAIRNSLIGSTVITKDGQSVIVRAYKPAMTPNDPLANQWWQPITGIAQFWDMPAPKKQTVLAVIDTGVALNHQEFNGRLFQNQGEIGPTSVENPSILNCTDRGLPVSASCNLVDDNVDGIVDNETGATTYENPSRLNCTDQGLPLNKNCNNIDDDHNGYIDDVTGWDFINFDNKPLAGELNPTGSGTQHGTMVAGIAAANGNNGVGTAGVDWYTKILPIQAIDDDGYGNSFSVANAVRYAADMGADVINLSLGSDYPDSYLLSSIEYAIGKNVVVVAAAGNTNCDCMIYPAAYDVTLSVGALDQTGARASFSSYGAALDVMAPGVSITSSTYTSSNQTSAYATGSGTSFAAPIVSGLITRLRGQLPTANVTQLTALVTEQTKEVMMGQSAKTNTNGYGTSQLNQSGIRALTPVTVSQAYSFGSVTDGGLFGGTDQQTQAYKCESSKVGTTTLFRATSATRTLYTINYVDKRLASANGYTVTPAFNACILQPNDTPQTLRVLNTPLEFDNVLPK